MDPERRKLGVLGKFTYWGYLLTNNNKNAEHLQHEIAEVWATMRKYEVLAKNEWSIIGGKKGNIQFIERKFVITRSRDLGKNMNARKP